MPIDVDDILLSKIEEVVAQGCTTSPEIAKAIGLNERTFEKIRLGGRKNGVEEKRLIGEAIKKGTARQPVTMLPVLELALMKGILGHTVTTRTVKTSTGGKFGDTEDVTLTEKYIPGNSALLIFALDNASRRLDDANNRRWINRQFDIKQDPSAIKNKTIEIGYGDIPDED